MCWSLAGLSFVMCSQPLFFFTFFPSPFHVASAPASPAASRSLPRSSSPESPCWAGSQGAEPSVPSPVASRCPAHPLSPRSVRGASAMSQDGGSARGSRSQSSRGVGLPVSGGDVVNAFSPLTPRQLEADLGRDGQQSPPCGSCCSVWFTRQCSRGTCFIVLTSTGGGKTDRLSME